jgi:hypothetical protein
VPSVVTYVLVLVAVGRGSHFVVGRTPGSEQCLKHDLLAVIDDAGQKGLSCSVKNPAGNSFARLGRNAVRPEKGEINSPRAPTITGRLTCPLPLSTAPNLERSQILPAMCAGREGTTLKYSLDLRDQRQKRRRRSPPTMFSRWNRMIFDLLDEALKWRNEKWISQQKFPIGPRSARSCRTKRKKVASWE